MMKIVNKLIFFCLVICSFGSINFANAAFDSPDTKQQFYYLIDLDTKEVLAQKNADILIPPSSMTKVMTAFVAFDLVEKGLLDLDLKCKIGYDAWRKSGSSMFLNHGDELTMAKLLEGLLAVSGNDAAVAIAKNASGSEKEFVKLMNKVAKEIGLRESHFKNPHGLYEKGHYMSLRDLAKLAMTFYERFPQYTKYLSIKKFTYQNITQYNRNPLMKKHYDGVVAGKTGHTNQGGYGVLGIVKRDNRRLIGVINKAKTPRQRTSSIIKLFDYGFNKYKQLTLFKSGQEVASLKTWLGKKTKVKAIIKDDVIFNVKRSKNLEDITAKVKFLGPIYAPIYKDTKIADLIITIDKNKEYKYPLFAKNDVKKSGYLAKLRQILRYKIDHFLR